MCWLGRDKRSLGGGGVTVQRAGRVSVHATDTNHLPVSTSTVPLHSADDDMQSALATALVSVFSVCLSVCLSVTQ